MARVVIYLRDQEASALQRLAEQEYRAIKAQAALIIRKELDRLGLVAAEANDGTEPTAPFVEQGGTESTEAHHDHASS